MADVIDLAFRVNSDELREASGHLDDMDAAGSRVVTSNSTLSGSFVSLGKVIGALGLGALIREGLGTADDYNSMNARLGLVTDGVDAFAKAQSALIQIATDTRTPLDEVFNLYTRIVTPLEDMGHGDGGRCGIHDHDA